MFELHWKAKNGNSGRGGGGEGGQHPKPTNTRTPEWLTNISLRWKCYCMTESTAIQNKTNNVLALTGGRNVYRESSGVQAECCWKYSAELSLRAA